LAGAFQEVAVSQSTFLRPKLTTGARPYIKSRITSDNPAHYTPSTPVTDQASMTVPGLAVRILVDEVSAEDSAVAAIPVLQRLMLSSLEDAYEDCMVNGDTAATHQDAIATWNARSRWGSTGLGGSADHRRAFMGLRAYCLDIGAAAKADGNSVQTAAGFLASLAELGERAASDLVCVMSPEYMVKKVMGWSEVLTLNNYGPGAAIMGGAIAKVFGIPIILSRFMTADLNASGLWDDTTETQSGFLLVDRAAWFNYRRRGPTMEMAKEIKSGHHELVGTLSKLFASPDATSVVNAHYTYNLL
jgi:hypothetical protein